MSKFPTSESLAADAYDMLCKPVTAEAKPETAAPGMVYKCDNLPKSAVRDLSKWWLRSLFSAGHRLCSDLLEWPFPTPMTTAEGNQEFDSCLEQTSNDTLKHIPCDSPAGISILQLFVDGGASHLTPLSAHCTYSGPSNCTVTVCWKRNDFIKTRTIQYANSWTYQPNADDMKFQLIFSIEIRHSSHKPVTQEVIVPPSLYAIDKNISLEVEKCVRSMDVCWEVTNLHSADFYILRVNQEIVQLILGNNIVFQADYGKEVLVSIDYTNPFGFWIHANQHERQMIPLIALTHIQRDVITLTIRSYLALYNIKTGHYKPYLSPVKESTNT